MFQWYDIDVYDFIIYISTPSYTLHHSAHCAPAPLTQPKGATSFLP